MEREGKAQPSWRRPEDLSDWARKLYEQRAQNDAAQEQRAKVERLEGKRGIFDDPA